MDAIVKQTNGSMAIIPSTPGGLINAEQLTKIAQMVTDGIGLAKFTVGQRIAILTSEEKVDEVIKGLAEVGLKPGPVGHTFRNVKACCGDLCGHALQSALTDGIALDEKFAATELPFSFKVGISGCSRNCMEAQCQDLGFKGTVTGYKVYIGGRGGGLQQHGQLLAENVEPKDMEQLVHKVLSIYKNAAQPGERLFKVLARIGIEAFKNI